MCETVGKSGCVMLAHDFSDSVSCTPHLYRNAKDEMNRTFLSVSGLCLKFNHS